MASAAVDSARAPCGASDGVDIGGLDGPSSLAEALIYLITDESKARSLQHDVCSLSSYVFMFYVLDSQNYSRYSLGMKFLAHLLPRTVVIIRREQFIATKLKVGRSILEKTPLALG